MEWQDISPVLISVTTKQILEHFPGNDATLIFHYRNRHLSCLRAMVVIEPQDELLLSPLLLCRTIFHVRPIYLHKLVNFQCFSESKVS